MAQCSEIEAMLEPFGDGELNPQQMCQVALHVAKCGRCEDALTDVARLGKYLREASFELPLDSFTQTVMKRVADVRPPIHTRLQQWLDSLSERWAAGLALGSATVAVAALTAILLAPYARQFANQVGGGVKPMVMAMQDEAGHAATMAARNSQAVISRLESEAPSVGLWSEPENDTTVIWLPDER